MGIAAYNRGSAMVSRGIDARFPDHNSEVVRAINSLPRGKTVLFRPTVVRMVPFHGWMIMNHPDNGFASYGYEYKTLRELFAVWNCYVVGFGTDAHSFFYNVEPA